MKRRFVYLAVFVAVFMSLGFGSCSEQPLSDLPGHYEGTLFLRPNEGAGYSTLVRAEVSGDGKGHGHVEVKDLHDNSIQKIELTNIVTTDRFNIRVPGFVENSVEILKKDGCYLRDGAQGLRFCSGNNAITLEISVQGRGAVFTLALDRFKKNAALSLETPGSLSLSKAVAYAFRRSFDNLVEFENVKQARLTRKLARSNLLPGVSINSIFGLYQSIADVANLVTTIGDLAPFLLPTRWYQANEADLKSKAEEDALILLRADTATQVEGFAYIYARDLAIYQDYANTLDKAKLILDDIGFREELGQLLPGTLTEDVRLVISNIKQTLFGLKLALKEDKAAIALTLGYHNPDAITDFTLDNEDIAIDNAPAVDGNDLKGIAIDRSFELRQLDYLIEVARYQKKERYFNWLDPAGDYTGKLGFGIGAYVEIASSQIAALSFKREGLQTQVLSKVQNAVDEYQSALELHAEVKDGLDAADRRLNRMLDQVRFGTNLDMPGLVQIFQDYLSQEINEENAIAAYRVARAKVDRFRLTGFYSGLALKLGPNH